MIELGSKVKDTVTGFVGVAICRVEYLNGCVQYGIKRSIDKDGKTVDAEYIDEGQLEIVIEKKEEPNPYPFGRGGPSSDAPGGSNDMPGSDGNFDTEKGNDDNWAPS